ncbi:hypothetical protein SAMN05444695_101406 [Rhodococcus triatomae]|uniref:Uncharacterized protein n=1 Tax=Rhodococcus triatomae TaxID=300028 RepID=A0A1G8AF63_9NOCA|nr:hypothetical protein SAMN05444695_101406 [Rhodococcus triatomae]
MAPGGPLDDSSDPARPGAGAVVAAVLALVGGVAVAVGPLSGVVRANAPGAETLSAVPPAAVWAGVFALLVPVLAAGALLVRATAVSGALLAGGGAIAVGMAIQDLQLWTGALDANRFELFRPDTAAPLDAGAGAYLVLGGHVLAAVAGLAGLFVVQRAALSDGYGGARSAERDGRATGARVGVLPAALVVLAAAGVAASLFAPTYSSDDPVILVPTVLAADAATAAGAAAVSAALLVVVASALASISPPVAAGALVGAATAVLGLVGARFVGGVAAGDRIEPGSGTVWGTACAAVLLVTAVAIPVVDRIRDERSRRALDEIGREHEARSGDAARVSPSGKGVAKAAVRAEAEAARSRRIRWHVSAGVGALGAAALAALGAFLPVLELADGLPEPQILAVRTVPVAALVVAVTAVWLLLSEFAAAVRPVVAVVWAGIPVTVAAVTQPVLLAADVPGVSIGPGAVVLWLGALAAAGSAVLVWFAGSAEREDVDTSARRSPNPILATVGGAAAIAAVAGVAFPLFHGTDRRGTEHAATSFAGLPWDIDSWGHVLFAAVVVIAVAVASCSRPPRAAALFAGVALLSGVHLAAFPLTRGVLDQVEVGPGALATAVGIVLSLVATALAVRSKTR